MVLGKEFVTIGLIDEETDEVLKELDKAGYLQLYK